MAYLNIFQHNFCIDPLLGASPNTGKGYYKLTVTSGGTTTPVAYTHYVKGMTSNATAVLMNLTNTSGTFAGGNWAGTFHISEATGTFTAGGEILGLYLCSNDTQVSADIATIGASVYAVDSFSIFAHVTAAKGSATTAPINGIAKSPAPTNTALTASVSQQSLNVTLSAAVTLDLCTCNTTTGWAAYNGASVGTNTTNMKEGSASETITLPATPATNTKYASFLVSTGVDTNCSGYQQLNLWAMCSTGSNMSRFVVKLCSDEAGTTAVHTFTLTINGGTNTWVSHVFNNAANLGTNIRSIGIYSGTPAPVSVTLVLDNIFLSKATTDVASLTLDSLVGFSSADNVTSDMWYCIKSIVGTALKLEGALNSNVGVGRGLIEATKTNAALYKREAWVVNTNTSATTNVQAPPVAGANGTYIKWEGGINPKTLVQEGYSIYTCNNGFGYAIAAEKDMNSYNRIGLCKYNYGMNNSTGYTLLRLGDMMLIGCSTYGLNLTGQYAILLDGHLITKDTNNYNISLNGHIISTTNSIIYAHNQVAPGGYQAIYLLQTTPNAMLNKVYCYNNSESGICLITGHLRVKELYCSNNGNRSVYLGSRGYIFIDYAVLTDATDIYGTAGYPNLNGAWISQLGGTANNDQITSGTVARAYKQSTEKPADASFAWKLSPASNTFRSLTPFDIKLGDFPCQANKAVTFKVRVKVSNTDIIGGIKVPALYGGMTTDQIATSTSTTASWGEEITLTFTPTVSGVLPLYMIAYYINTSAIHTYSAYIAHPAAVGGVIPLYSQAT